MKLFTRNSRKFTGRHAEKEAQRFINKRAKWGQHWEFVENGLTRSVVMRRRNLE